MCHQSLAKSQKHSWVVFQALSSSQPLTVGRCFKHSLHNLSAFIYCSRESSQVFLSLRECSMPHRHAASEKWRTPILPKPTTRITYTLVVRAGANMDLNFLPWKGHENQVSRFLVQCVLKIRLLFKSWKTLVFPE